jgi:hypothetical protein
MLKDKSLDMHTNNFFFFQNPDDILSGYFLKKNKRVEIISLASLINNKKRG